MNVKWNEDGTFSFVRKPKYPFRLIGLINEVSEYSHGNKSLEQAEIELHSEITNLINNHKIKHSLRS